MYQLQQKRFGKFRAPRILVETETKREMREFLRDNPHFICNNVRLVTITVHGPTAIRYNMKEFAGVNQLYKRRNAG